jgi:hypothetical protein
MAWRRAGRPAADPARVICLTVDLGNVVYSMSAHIVVSPCIKEESVCLIWYISLIHSLYLLGASIFYSGNLLLSLNTRLSWKAVLGDAASASLHLPIYLSSDFIWIFFIQIHDLYWMKSSWKSQDGSASCKKVRVSPVFCFCFYLMVLWIWHGHNILCWITVSRCPVTTHRHMILLIIYLACGNIHHWWQMEPLRCWWNRQPFLCIVLAVSLHRIV